MPKKYSETYKHFDRLIWQLPGWSTGIFIFMLSGLNFIYKFDFTKVNVTLNKDTIINIFLVICILFQGTIFNALVRFRVHQLDCKPDNLPIIHWLISGQFWLQIVTIFQLSSIIFIFMNRITNLNCAKWVFIISVLLLFIYSIVSIRYIKRSNNTSC